MKVLRFFLPILPIVFLTGCEKEIDIDYRQAEPLYVAEASINQDETNVRLTTTRAMDDNTSENSVVTGATVTITDQEGYSTVLSDKGNGYYTAARRGRTGYTYTVDIDIDGQHFTSTSTMKQAPVMNSIRWIWRKILTEKMLFIDLKLQDIPDEINYYFVHVFRNNLGYRWAVFKDDQNTNDELRQLFSCMTERQMEKGTDDDVVNEGDRIRIDIRSIDKRAYDYLYSMELATRANTNPIQNFTGGCLGYFTAYQSISYYCVFHMEDTEEDDE